MPGNERGLLPAFTDLLLDAVFVVDREGRIVDINRACERILGYRPDEMIGRQMFDFVAPEDHAKTWEEAQRVMAGTQSLGFENRYRHKDGHLVSMMWSARWSERDQFRIGVAHDVTERKRTEALQAATYAISEAVHAAGDLGALLREIHHIIARLVPATGLAVALSDERSGALAFPYMTSGEVEMSLALATRARQLGAEVASTNLPKLLFDAESWLAVPITSVNKPIGALVVNSPSEVRHSQRDKEQLQFFATQVAIAIERKRLLTELTHLAQYDSLTGLPNRRTFLDRFGTALARTRRTQDKLAVLFIDLDDFKQVNDLYGHAAGDLLLQEVARRLKHCLREEDTVARLSGDEFVALLEHMQQADDAATVAEKLRAFLSQPVQLEDCTLRISSSIGIALFPDHGDGVEELLKHADATMYSEKRDRR